jgi:HEPN domain-containing protein
MDSEKQIHYWIDSSIEDLETAAILLEKKRYLHGLFFCHLAVEKTLKGLYVKTKDELAPKTHNLIYLCSLSGIELSDATSELFAILMKYQISGRYPDNSAAGLEKEAAFDYYRRTEEAVVWLRRKFGI